MEKLTMRTANGWHLKGVPDAALNDLERNNKFGSRVIRALELLSLLEANGQEGGWRAPDDFSGLESGKSDVLVCFLEPDEDPETAAYAVLRYFKGGDQLDNELPRKRIPGLSAEQRLLSAIFDDGLDKYKRYASQSGFYELSAGQDGYLCRRLINTKHIAGWQPLPCPPVCQAKEAIG